jgi:membrane-bound lytic murein transglycosylase D
MQKGHLAFLYFLTFLCLSLTGYLLLQRIRNEEPIAQAAEQSLFITSKGSFRDSVKIFNLPDTLSFAGESVPITIPDVRERLERELYVNAYWESNMVLLMKRSTKFLPQIEEWLKANQIPEDFKYLAIAESGLMNVSSPAGARGFWQFMESTAKEYGLEVNNDVDERYHLEKSTNAAAGYLKKAHQKFGDWTAVAASYNMGQTGFARRQEEQLIDNYYELYLNDETSRYLFRILAFKVIFESPSEFGFYLHPEDYYQSPPFRTIVVKEDIKNLASWAKMKNSSYKELKQYNPWLRDKDLNVKRGRTYELLLPE